MDFFGFFDVIHDYKIAEELLNTVNKWAKQHNFKEVIGPVNFSTNDTCGVFIDGMQAPPAIMMTYHTKYHHDFFRAVWLQEKDGSACLPHYSTRWKRKGFAHSRLP